MWYKVNLGRIPKENMLVEFIISMFLSSQIKMGEIALNYELLGEVK